MQWNNKENRLKPLLSQPCLCKIPWECRSMLLKELMKKVFARCWWPCANFCSFAPLVSTQQGEQHLSLISSDLSPKILWSKVRYFSQLGDRQFIGQPGLQVLQAIDGRARGSSCCCCCFPARVIALFRRPQWNWGTAFHENYFFFFF